MPAPVPEPGPVLPHPSPNFGPRRDGLLPSLVVIHFTGMAAMEEALDRLCAPEYEVSAHYLIARDGRLFQLVEEQQRAWHAGHGSWGGAADINSRSIGIELDNTGATPFSAPLMDRLEALLETLLARWKIPAQGVIGHQDFAPTRKWDPGPRFDWQRLARTGLAVWPDAGATGEAGKTGTVGDMGETRETRTVGKTGNTPDDAAFQRAA